MQGEEEEAFLISSAALMVVWHNPAVAMPLEKKGQAGEIFRVESFQLSGHSEWKGDIF